MQGLFAFVGFNPDALHLRFHFAITILANTTAWAIT